MANISYWIKEKFWMTPAIFSILAVLLSIGFFYVDLLLVERYKEFIPSILLTKVDLAKTIMGTLSGALLTMSTFTFSTILVVLTMYSSQFSPRALKNFVHDKVTWRVLGVFLGGFIYNTLSLLFMRDDLYTHDVISTFIGILIAFYCLATFTYFIHYIATTVQVGKLVDELIEDTERVISRYQDLQEEKITVSKSLYWSPSGSKHVVAAKKEGYLQFLALDKLKNYAEEHELQIEINAAIGDFIYEGMSVMHIYSDEDEDFEMEDFCSIGNERLAEQDISYALQKLVEIALRAISPGINDPNTANDIIIRIGSLLGKIGHLETGNLVLLDQNGNQTVLYHFPSYENILYNVYFQLSHYGKEDISVLFSMADSLQIAAKICPDYHHPTLWKIQLYVLEVLKDQDLKSYDHKFLQGKVNALAEATKNRPISI
ncbi:DUF2254 domain-containing protein [Planomicrobium sp. CPCC 101079]|uniref:DUF2254 domain-containing protein n=1 Tax=Planomicrobium sp. CPCC 101079 TaxID=2599618 RepID=UPI0011B677BB|nr:DUF2254 domain-containing protein [Planomicrobium sp. CPCC 101079]TWT09288.1 DUF2254 domain-containing protein [Planomicrobium sp. CPCC 101079]